MWKKSGNILRFFHIHIIIYNFIIVFLLLCSSFFADFKKDNVNIGKTIPKTSDKKFTLHFRDFSKYF